MPRSLDRLELRFLHEFVLRGIGLDALADPAEKLRRRQDALIRFELRDERIRKHRVGAAAGVEYRLIPARGNQEARAFGQLVCDVLLRIAVGGSSRKEITWIGRQHAGV